MAKFENLIKDIYDLIDNPDFEISEDNLSVFLENLGESLRENFAGKSRRVREAKLVASNYGLPARRLWFSLHPEGTQGDKKFSAQQRINFIYGNILEELVLLFAKEAGHEVEDMQDRVVVEGVSGKKDARIDGVVTDVKSASSYSFKKFKEGDFLLDDDSDPFAYKSQLGLYMAATNETKGAFVVINKENGELVSVVLDRDFDVPDVHLTIENARINVEKDHPPVEKCYPEIASGKSGNMIISKLCSFCEHKDRCWEDSNEGKGLIRHDYYNGPVYFTTIKRPPNSSKELSNTDEV